MLAYHIMGSANPEYASRLVDWIHSPNNIYLVTFDNLPALKIFKQNWSPRGNVNCILTPPITWGGISIVSATLWAMGQLLHLNSDWRYFIPLSDSDVPLKRQSDICEILEAKAKSGKTLSLHLNPQRIVSTDYDLIDYSRPLGYRKQLGVRRDVSFVVHDQLADHFQEMTESPIYVTTKRLQFHVTENRRDKTLYIRPLEHNEALFRKSVFTKYKPLFGKFWCILSRESCDWLTHWEDLPLLFTAFSSTFIPDESFLHTALGGEHSPWHRQIETSNRFRWHNGTADAISDLKLSALQACECFFARKVQSDQCARLFHWIDSWSAE